MYAAGEVVLAQLDASTYWPAMVTTAAGTDGDGAIGYMLFGRDAEHRARADELVPFDAGLAHTEGEHASDLAYALQAAKHALQGRTPAPPSFSQSDLADAPATIAKQEDQIPPLFDDQPSSSAEGEARGRRTRLKREAKREVMETLDNTPLRHSRDVTGPHPEIRKPSATSLRAPSYNAKARAKAARCARKPRSKVEHIISAIAPPPSSSTLQYLAPAVEAENGRASPPSPYVSQGSESPLSTPSKRATSPDPMEVGCAEEATALASEAHSLSTISPISPPHHDVELGPGAFVLAKFAEYSHWPGRVNVCSLDPWVGKWKRECIDGEVLVWVIFLNSYTGEWCFQRNIVEFTQRNVAALCESGNGDMEEDLEGAVEEAFDRIEELRSEEVVSEDLGVGDVVLAKYDEYPPWPAIITRCGVSYEEEEGQWRKEGYLHCYFLGEENKENWVERSRVRRFSARRAASTRVRRNNVMHEDYMRAVEEATSIAVEASDSEESAMDGRSDSLTGLNYTALRRQLME